MKLPVNCLSLCTGKMYLPIVHLKENFFPAICMFFSNFQAANTFQERFLSILSPGQWILFARGHLDKFSDPTILFSVSNSAVSSLNYLTRGVLSMKNLLAQKTSFALHFAAAPVFCGHTKLQLLLPIQYVNISTKH